MLTTIWSSGNQYRWWYRLGLHNASFSASTSSQSRTCNVNPNTSCYNFIAAWYKSKAHTFQHTVGFLMYRFKTNECRRTREINFCYATHSSFFQNMLPTLPTVHFSHWGAIYPIACSFLWSRKRSYLVNIPVLHTSQKTQTCSNLMQPKSRWEPGLLCWWYCLTYRSLS